MIQELISVTSLLLTSFSSLNPYTVIDDQSELTYLNPTLQNRKTLKLQLANGLEALIISDEMADQSAAAVRVGVGSWNDPFEYPGMAHFCEHMLFMGTEKYPSENEFSSLITDYAGETNAFTAPDRTVYMLSCQERGFLPLLDRFANFFINPLFNPSNIAREMHAVDQEHAKNIENDGWREYMIFKETGNPEHPNRSFSTGSSETLSKIPPQMLKKWHKEQYGADKMHLVVYSSLPLDLLKEEVVKIFSEVPISAQNHIDTNGLLSSRQQLGAITFIKPVQNLQTVTLTWELPQELSLDPSKSVELIAFALDRGQPHSLYEKLQKEHLIDHLSVRVDDLGGPSHKLLQMSLELTKKGMAELEIAILHCFEGIANIKEHGIPEYLHHEKNAMARLNYEYQERESPFKYITSLADHIAYEHLSTFPKNTLLSSHLDPAKIATVLSYLSPQNCMISVMADPSITKVQPTKKEKWLGGEYELRPIPEKWMRSWTHALANPDIKTPGPNPFIPENLRLIQTAGSLPTLIASDHLGEAFYVRSSEFGGPESVYHLHILSPSLNISVKSSVLASLYLDHLTDVLHPTLSAAKSAGLSCAFSLERCSLHLALSGYSEKAPLLLQHIAKEMSEGSLPSLEQFAIYFDRHEKAYLNGEKELAAKQAKELADAIVSPHAATRKEKLQALRSIPYEEFLAFHQNLLETTYLKALFAGNLTIKDAERAWLDVIHFLGKPPYSKEDHPMMKTIQLPEKGGPFKLTQQIDVQGNAALLLIDEGDFSFQKKAAQEVLTGALKEAFYNELRTKQKTGYIVSSGSNEVEKRLFRTFIVQSNSHQPEELLFRFEQFIEIFNDSLAEEIPQERFLTLKRSLMDSLKNRFRNLATKSSLWDFLAFEKKGDFAFVPKKIQALEDLEYSDFLHIAHDFLSRENKKRMAVLFEGKLANPFAYQPITLPEMSEIANSPATLHH